VAVTFKEELSDRLKVLDMPKAPYQMRREAGRLQNV
jgi:hypothetical protein